MLLMVKPIFLNIRLVFDPDFKKCFHLEAARPLKNKHHLIDFLSYSLIIRKKY